MRLTLVRHGISEQTGHQVVDGDLDLELSPAGIQGVKEIAPFVNEREFDYIYSSTLQRAYKTGQILCKGKKQIIKDSRLVELRMGQWRDNKVKELASKYAFDEFGNVLENYVDFAEDAETFMALKQRVSDFLLDLLQDHTHQTIMVVAHGITFRAVMAVIFKTDMNTFINMNNVAFTEIYFNQQNKPRLMSFNSKYPVMWGFIRKNKNK